MKKGVFLTTFLWIFFMKGLTFGAKVEGVVRVEGMWRHDNVLISIENDNVKGLLPTKEHSVMNQKSTAFIPYILPILKGTTVDFINSDDGRHNVYSPSKPNTFNLGTYPKGKKSFTFGRPGIVTIFCDVHPSMKAFVIVLETPFFSVTDRKGRYSIDGIPPGKCKITLWHEKTGKKVEELEIKDDKAFSVNFNLGRDISSQKE